MAVVPPWTFASAACTAVLSFSGSLHALAVEAEMRSERFVVRPFEPRAKVHVRAFGNAIRIMVHVALFHRQIFLVVEDDDEDRQAVLLGCAERLNDRIIEKAAVADDQNNRTVARRELHAERGADALAEPAKAAEEALRCREGQVLANERSGG